MLKRIRALSVVVSALLVMLGSSVSAAVPNLPTGSKVFIASANGFETFLGEATAGADYPLVFVRTKAEADFELVGATAEARPDREGVSDTRTTRQDTTITIRHIKSGEVVYTHTVRTEITSPNGSTLAARATRARSASNLLHRGKKIAATNCAAALRAALTS